MRQVDLSRLQSQLLTSGIQQTNNALYQVITQLLSATKQLQDNINLVGGTGSGGGGSSAVQHLTYITQLLISGGGDSDSEGTMGPPGIQGASYNPFTGGYWEPLTDGDIDETELIYASGRVIMTYVP